MSVKIEHEMEKIIESIMNDYDQGREIDKMDNIGNRQDKEAIIDIINKLFKIMYPGYFRNKAFKTYNIKPAIMKLRQYNFPSSTINTGIMTLMVYCMY